MKLNTLDEACAAAWRGAVRGLAWQGWEKCGDGESCLLTSPDGKHHCARGWLMIDPPKTPRARTAKYAKPLEDFMRENGTVELRRFINSLQYAHDRTYPGNSMRKAFAKIGRDRGWKWPSGVEQPPGWEDPA